MCISGQVSAVSRFQIIHRQYALFSPYKPYSYSVNQHFKLLLHSIWPKRRSYYELSGGFAKFKSLAYFHFVNYRFPFRFVSQITVGLGNDVYQCVSLQISCDKKIHEIHTLA